MNRLKNAWKRHSMVRFYSRLVVSVTVILALSCTSHAELNVSDTLSGGTWSIADSPIKVQGNIILPDGADLNIEPGVVIEFTGPYSFLIEGKLIAVGTSTDSIVFTTENPDSNSLRWKGLRFIDAERGCLLAFCIVEYGLARGDWPRNCGGGIYISGCSPTITRCTIANNKSEGDGGGIYTTFTTTQLRNNLIVNNRSEKYGGGIFTSYAGPSIVNCTITKNSTQFWGGGIFVGVETESVICNSILADNYQDRPLGDRPSGDVYFKNLARARSAVPMVLFTCIYDTSARTSDPFPGQGNITADPQFINPDVEPYDFHLKYSSPCIDTGDPEMNPGSEPDILVNRVNMGAYGGTEDAALSVPVFYNSDYHHGRQINFSSIRINAVISEEITIENLGHYWLFIYGFQFSSHSFFSDSVEVEGRFIPEWAAEPIEPGAVLKYTVNFRPDELREYQDTLRIVSNDTLQPQPFLVLAGEGINPIGDVQASLEFGERQIDDSHNELIYVSNLGTSVLNISSVKVQGDGYSGEAVRENISPSDSGAVRITFKPAFAEEYNASLKIATNDRDLAVSLHGWGTGPKMVIEVDSLNLGYVYAGGGTFIDSVNVHNQGDEPLVIDSVAISVPAFSIPIPPGGLEIPADSTAQLFVHFRPTQPDMEYADEIIIYSNYPEDHIIELWGRGMAEPGRYISGAVGEETWDWWDGHEDYIVLDSAYVPHHERLKIVSGARVLFEPGAFMLVEGELRAVGQPEDSIRFIPRSDTTFWGGIQLHYEDATRLSYCLIRGSINGGLSIYEASPLIQFCTIVNNSTDDAESCGGIYLENSGARIIGCIIDHNQAPVSSGIYARNSKPVINNCIISNNGSGGVFLRFESSALMQNNLIYQNEGVGITISNYSAPLIINNTIAYNNCAVSAEVRSVPVLMNNILWGNEEVGIDLDESSNALVSYCDAEGGFEGNYNLEEDPLFENQAFNDYRLAENSPLIDMGNPEWAYRDHFLPPSLGTDRCDIGAYGGPLGGSWEIPEVSISVFQNPAFKHWLDIFVTSLDAFEEAPVCTLETGDMNKVAVPLSQSIADEYTYLGSYEARASGSLFITIDAILAGSSMRVSRSYELTLVGPEGGTIRMVGAVGEVIITPEANNGSFMVLSGYEMDPIKPVDGKLFLTPMFFIRGMDDPLDEFVELRMVFNSEGWAEMDLERLGIYRFEHNRWQRLKGGYQDGLITGRLDRGGQFALVWDERFDPDKDVLSPQVALLVSAYPNPFNREVTIDFNIKKTSHIYLAVYDLAGRRVAELVNESLSPGTHSAVWNGRTAGGNPFPSGIYWARLESEENIRSVKLLLLR